MTNMNTFQKVIAEIAGAFKTQKAPGAKDDDDVIFVLKDDAPEWMKDFTFMHKIHAALDGRGPDDWVYEHTYRLACDFSEREAESADDLRNGDSLHEIVDGMVDIYNSDRLRWLAMNLVNVDLCDEARESGVVADDASMLDRIAAGQYMALERIANALLDAAEERASEIEEE